MLRKWPYHTLPLIALLLWVAAAIGHRAAERQLAPAKIAALIQSDLAIREKHFSETGRHSGAVLTWIYNKAAGSTANWVPGQDFGLYAYRGDSLIAWSTNTILPVGKMDTGGRLYRLRNGIYYGYGRNPSWLPSGTSLGVLYPIALQYPLANEYLRAHFVASDAIDPRTPVTDTSGADAVVLRAPDGHALGYVHTLHGIVTSRAPAGWIIWCWALALIAACGWIHAIAVQMAARKSAGYAIMLVVATALLLRGLMYVRGLPFQLGETELFSPRLYAASDLLSSLGDLLLNTLAVLWIITFIAGTAPLRKWYHGASLPQALRWAAAMAVNVLLAGAVLFYVRLIRSLVLDSLIPFDNVHLSSLDSTSLTGLLIASLLTTNLLVFAALTRNIVESLLPNIWARALAIVAGFAVMLLLRSGEGLLPVYIIACLWLFIVVVVGQHAGRLRESKSIFHAANLFWSVAYCLLLTFLLQSFTRIRELDMRRNFAEHVATRHDDALEYNFSQIEPYIRTDTALQHFLQQPTSAGRKDLEERLATLYLNNSFAAYQAQVYLFDAGNKSLFNSDTTSITQLLSVINDAVPSRATTSLYYREAATSDHIYLGVIPVNSAEADVAGVLIIDLEQKKIVAETVLPELLQPGTVNQAEKSAGYSYAVYVDQKLVAQTSDYPFPFYIPRDTSVNEYHERKGKDFSTLIYTPDAHRTVYVWHRLGTLSEALTIFSYLLLLRFLLIGFISVYRPLASRLAHPGKGKLLAGMSLRRRVQFSVMGIVAFSFLLIGAVTVIFLNHQYANTNKARRQGMMQTVSRAIQQYVKEQGAAANAMSWRSAIAQPRFRYFLGRLAAAQKIDINLFDERGMLAIATQQGIYDQGLLAPVMRPDILAAMYAPQPKPLLMDEEKIGSLRYISCYAPLRDEDAGLAGFLNVPLFYSQRELDEQVSSVVVALINLYAVVFLLSSLLAVFITRWITRAFDVIIRQFGRLALHGNEPLPWPYDDEIGMLVTEYNKMVRKVEESVALLARSEREGAWREMARQVAHEIKNPLTPMKLNVQYLQRAIHTGQPNALELAARTSESLLEQINNLSIIASEFADFARISSKPQEIDLADVVRKVAGLYVNEPSADVHFTVPDTPVYVMADRSQLVRIVTNLMQNAVQAIPATRSGRIEVRLQLEGGEAVIEVQDNGEGISPEAALKLFTPYFTTKTSGTGLGLAMTRQMVEEWGGTIRYETVQDAGTTFIIRLPVHA